MTGRVRPLVPDDIPRLAALHQQTFGGGWSAQTLQSHLTELFCNNPWHEDGLPSWVYEGANGDVLGCLGVMPRRMSMNGSPVQLAVGHTFMVEPSGRSALAAVELLKRFMAGPQDLSLAEANDTSRRIWEGLGGTISLLYSIRWIRPLRTGRYLLSFLSARGLPAPLRLLLTPLSTVVDGIARRLPLSPFRQAAPALSAEEADAQTMLACLSEFPRTRLLRPVYDRLSLEWLLIKLAAKKQLGRFRAAVLRNDEQQIVGWYLYYLNAGGISEVVQIGATERSIKAVLDHLFDDAWRRGAIALSGQVDPRFMHAFTEAYCLFHWDHGDPTVLIHSRRPDVLNAVLRGDAFLTRLEGEWWIV